ncbi:MAG TPA: patatin-like phospholipase family protein [Ktedonobacteraceae bacterium]|nr:patatin-like phospholipase family protein [Ktedonobacteraceae bacterium]
MQNLEPRKLIEASPLFRNLQAHETANIIARLQPISFTRGERILESGVWHGQLYIIASGLVSILLREGGPTPSTALEEHAPLAVAQLGPGECFGEMSLITGEPPSATVRAEQDTMLWALPQADFLALVGTCPTLVHNINAILAQRLTRTNQQVLLHRTAERIWLAFVDDPAAPLERSLAVHIADALATRSQKRVLLLEVCAQDQAIGSHFATYPDQIRPSLLDCTLDHSRSLAHRASTRTPDGQRYAALAALTGGTDLDEIDTGILAHITEIAGFYDYLLLATTQATPASLLQATAEHSTSSIMLVSASEDVGARFIAPTLSSAPTSSSAPTLASTNQHPPALFVTHVPERPTIGAQDRYTRQLGYEVTRLLPADTPLLAQCWEQQKTLRQHAAGAELTKAVDFVARFLAHQTVGIAFGGGGARGFAHLGVLEQLVHHQVPVDYIAACSSGIITPGMYLIGKSFAESEEIFLQIQRNIVRWSLPRTSIFSNAGLKRMLRDLCGELRFEDLTTPFSMVAVDLSTRAGVVLNRGLLWQAGLASTALPGIFPPVLLGEHILMDAGMHDPVPIRLVRKMGADILIASELGGQEPPALEDAAPWFEKGVRDQQKHARSPHIIDLLLRTYDLAMATIGMHSIREADVVIRPKLHRISLRQFSEGRKFVAAGKEAVEQSLPELKKLLPWL